MPLLDAVATQRESVLSTFDTQREAIIKAVDEQRRAAMNHAGTAPARPAAARPGVPPSQAQQLRQQEVVRDIVATLKALVAEEVRSQLIALLSAAEARQNLPPTVTPPLG
ncbi:MAG TPA: hypothetical protein VMH86_06145 [Rhizomicrobium sp.]|nr:hypothetical protein [Rhizomicrobium sp.]